MHPSLAFHGDAAVGRAIANEDKPAVQAALRRVRAAAARQRGDLISYEHYRMLAAAHFLIGHQTWEAGELYREIGRFMARRILETGHEEPSMLDLHRAIGDFLLAHELVPSFAYRYIDWDPDLESDTGGLNR